MTGVPDPEFGGPASGTPPKSSCQIHFPVRFALAHLSMVCGASAPDPACSTRVAFFNPLASAIRMSKILPWGSARYADNARRYTSDPAVEFVAFAGVPQMALC
jgi:hypothetical protein